MEEGDPVVDDDRVTESVDETVCDVLCDAERVTDTVVVVVREDNGDAVVVVLWLALRVPRLLMEVLAVCEADFVDDRDPDPDTVLDDDTLWLVDALADTLLVIVAAAISLGSLDADGAALEELDSDALLDRDADALCVAVRLGGWYERVAVTVEVSVARLVELPERVVEADELTVVDAVDVRECEEDTESVGLVVGERVPRPVTVVVPVTDGVRVPLVLAVEEPDTVLVRVPVLERVPVLLALVEGDTLFPVETVPDIDAEREVREDPEGDAVAVEEQEARLLGLSVGDVDIVDELATVRLTDVVTAGLRDPLVVVVAVGLWRVDVDAEAVCVELLVAVLDVESEGAAVPDLEAELVSVEVIVVSADFVRAELPLPVRVAVVVAVDVGDPDPVRLGVLDRVSVGVPEPLRDRCEEADWEFVELAVRVTAEERDVDTVAEADRVDFAEPDDVGDAVVVCDSRLVCDVVALALGDLVMVELGVPVRVAVTVLELVLLPVLVRVVVDDLV